MSFRDFVGNRAVVDTIRRQIAAQRLPHSLLFSGIAGVGKWTLAQFLAKTLNCSRLDKDFCNECASCRKISEGSYPDVKNIGPDSQFILIDQVREISREVFFRPFEGRQRVFIIDEAERLNAAAANSFLKTLEEPPDTSTLILVTARPNELLPTIRSRCQLYRFTPIPSADIERLLQSQLALSSEDRNLLARVATGSLGRALTLDLAEYRMQREEMLALLETCAGNCLYSQSAKAAGPWLDRKNQSQFEEKLEILFTLFRDIYLLKLDPSTDEVIHIDVRSRLGSLSSLYSIEQLDRAARALDHIETGLRRNLNRSLAVDDLLLVLGGGTFA
jgi:DNA polymerase III subunit delta'